MSRAFCIPGVIFIICALVLNFLVSISLPYLPALDIARTHFGNGAVKNSQGLTEIRVSLTVLYWAMTNLVDILSSLVYGKGALAIAKAYNIEPTKPTQGTMLLRLA